MKESPEVPFMSLFELYSELNLIQLMEPDTEEAMRELNDRDWRGSDFARGQSWHTSFHASEFPGDDPDACPRFMAYRMMDFPGIEAMPPWVTTCGDVGKAGELSIARAWYEAGRSLTMPDDMAGGEQLVFEYAPAWLTGSVDLPVLKKGWRKPHIVEIKGKADEVVQAMQKGDRKYDEGHRRQVLTSLGLAHEHDWGKVVICEESWRLAVRLPVEIDLLDGVDKLLKDMQEPGDLVCREHGTADCLMEIDLEPPDTCSIYYWSRSWPRTTMEYIFSYDENYMRKGISVLQEAQAHFIADTIPPVPEGFMWSLGKCKNCAFKKKICRDDAGRKKSDTPVTVLSESHGVDWAREVKGDYDPEVARKAVLDRWAEAANPFLAGMSNG